MERDLPPGRGHPAGSRTPNTGGDAFIAGIIASVGTVLPPIGVLGVLFVLTGLLSSVITPVATVVLLAPIAIDTALSIGANSLAFVFGVLFAASSAFMTPIGYQTNLMVYGPGGYRFTDYVRVGTPLFLLVGTVATVGISVYWGL